MILGAHESIAGGPSKAFARALEHTAESLQIFTKNARGWKAKPLDPAEIAAFRAEQQRTGLPVVAHATYLINLGAEEPLLREKSIEGLADELSRCESLGIPGLVLHPGAHAEPDRGLSLVAEALDEAIARSGAKSARVLLENTAGQGSALGWRFEQLATILARARRASQLGLCLDTCHLFAAGYDLRSAEGFRATMAELDSVLGTERIAAFHLNDCKKPLGSRVDRHEEIGEGLLGLEAFGRLLEDPRFERVPGILETPEPDRYPEGLARLRSLAPASQARSRKRP